ncbi:putative prophage pi2 protein 38 [Clostridium botulinum C str. Eklund]|nr:putative prophage pi2 protein 38 [Clostridium botulinum C str. Eklund]NEZ50237.1 hypothetical protein [Clostridium botulinum]
MTDIKQWLKTTGMKVAEDHFKKPPALPYVIFKENTKVSGADNKNCLSNRSITVELYSEIINHKAEKNIENLLDEISIEYDRDRTWIESQSFFQTVYDFDLKEKI